MSTANGFFQYLKGENQFGPLQGIIFHQPLQLTKSRYSQMRQLLLVL